MSSTCTCTSTSTTNSLRPKVFGVGYSRTGTLSVCHALEKLGFGPCYHTFHIPSEKTNWGEWASILEGQADPELVDSLLEGYGSAMDNPVAFSADAVYKVYPDAKYILTIRDPDSWERSIRSTYIEPLMKYGPAILRQEAGVESEEDRQLVASCPWSPEQKAWGDAKSKVRDDRRFPYESPRIALFKHNEWIKKMIPADQLLIFDVKEGWGPLVKFLGVPEPKESFPRVNESTQYWDNLRKSI